MWTLRLVTLLCVLAYVSCYWGGRGRGWRGGWGGGRWRQGDGDTSDDCRDCKEPCLVEVDGEVDGGCTCPDGFNCTESSVKHYRWVYKSWRRIRQVVTYSYCERTEDEPEHRGPPCLAEKGDIVYNITCPDGFTCSVGPVLTVSGFTLTFCNYASQSDVDTGPWWDWYCSANCYDWKFWCGDSDWWGRRGYYRWGGCYRG